jgi:thiamine transporter ThiT
MPPVLRDRDRESMILQRFLEGLLAALSWLIDLLFARVMVVSVLVCLGLVALFLLIVRRGRMRGAAKGLPSLDDIAVAGKPDRPPV